VSDTVENQFCFYFWADIAVKTTAKLKTNWHEVNWAVISVWNMKVNCYVAWAIFVHEHQLFPTVPSDAARQAVKSRRGYSHSTLDLHQVFPGTAEFCPRTDNVVHTHGDSDVIAVPAGFRRHLVGGTLRSVYHCDIAEMRFVGKLVIVQTFSETNGSSVI